VYHLCLHFFPYVITISYYNGPPSYVLAEGLTTANRKETACYEMLHMASKLVGFCEHGNELLDSLQGGEFLD